MENNELEEMRAQLAALNEKLEKESIVSDKLISEATKKHISVMKRKLIIRMIVVAVLTPFIYLWISPYFLPWCLGVISLNLYIYLKTRKWDFESLNVADNSKRIHKMMKVYRRTRLLLMIFFCLFLILVGVAILLITGASIEGVSKFSLCLYIDIIVVGIYYVIDKIAVRPDVELVLEGILKELEE